MNTATTTVTVKCSCGMFLFHGKTMGQALNERAAHIQTSTLHAGNR